MLADPGHGMAHTSSAGDPPVGLRTPAGARVNTNNKAVNESAGCTVERRRSPLEFPDGVRRILFAR
jgi:hypothetical protein